MEFVCADPRKEKQIENVHLFISPTCTKRNPFSPHQPTPHWKHAIGRETNIKMLFIYFYHSELKTWALLIDSLMSGKRHFSLVLSDCCGELEVFICLPDTKGTTCLWAESQPGIRLQQRSSKHFSGFFMLKMLYLSNKSLFISQLGLEREADFLSAERFSV